MRKAAGDDADFDENLVGAFSPSQSRDDEV